jgi:hypothetical protein
MTINSSHLSSWLCSLIMMAFVVAATDCNKSQSPASTTFAPIPAELKAFTDGLDAMASGVDADLDGDGLPDVRTVVAGDGTRTVTLISALGYYGGPPLLTITYAANEGDVTATGDMNEDGTADFAASSVVTGDKLTEQQSWDTNDDELLDLRVTVVYQPINDRNAATITVTTEEATGDPPQFETTSSFTSSIRAEAGDPCEGLITYPSGDGSSISPLGRPNMRVMTNGEPGACSPEDANRIVDAINTVAGDLLNCISRENHSLYLDIARAMSGTNLQISCGDNCNLPNGTYGVANTEMPGRFRHIFDDPRMSLNMSKLGSDDCLASTLLHEMAHWSGTPHEGDATGQGGKDNVYACARYCGGCITDTKCAKGAGDLSHDCAKCARYNAEKSWCGSKEQWLEVEHGQITKMCHNQDDWTQYDDCTSAVAHYHSACDGTKLYTLMSTPCCVSCAAGEDANSFSCATWYGADIYDGAPYIGDGTSPWNNCGTPPNCM